MANRAPGAIIASRVSLAQAAARYDGVHVMAASQELPEDMSRQKWWQIPSALTVDLAQVRSINTLKLVLFIARQTFGWGVRSAMMSYDEMRHGRSYAPGKRMKDVSGLRNDQAIVDAIRDALERGLIEVQQTTEGMAYRIPDRYWNEAELVPSKGEFWRYSPSWAVYVHGSAQENRADWGIATANTNGSAQKRRADELEKLSTAIGIPEHSQKKNLAQPLRESAPDVAPPALLYTSLNTSERDTPDRYGGPSAALQAPLSLSTAKRADENEPTHADAPPQAAAGKRSPDDTETQDLDALQQRQVAEHALQKLLAEQEQLRALLPSQRGWGAAQGRLRAIAWEIARLQPLAAPPAPAASPAEPEAAGEVEPSEARRSPALRLSQRGNAPTESEQDTRWQRLTKLQGELAHLKKSPSMQLLARQRIPRLEAEIKQLIASLAESA